MAEEDGNNDMEYFSNQPYDMEVKISQDENEEKDIEEKKDNIDMNQQEEDGEPKYEEAKIQQTVKPLPKFDISKFDEIKASPEAKELLTIMKR